MSNSIQTTRENLLAAFAIVKPVVEARAAITILTCIRIRASAFGITIQATDLDTFATADLSADASGEFELIVPFRNLEKLVRNSEKGTEIRFEPAVVTREGRGEYGDEKYIAPQLETFVAIGAMQVKLMAHDPRDWPAPPLAKPMKHAFSLATADFLPAMRKTQFAISTEETRYYLNGVFMHAVTIDGRDMLRFVATDSHRLARLELPAPEGSAGMPGVIVPRATVAHIVKLCAAKGAADAVSINVGADGVTFSIGAAIIRSKIIDGTFPDYNRVIPAGNDKRLTVERDALARAVKQVSSLSSERGRAVKLEISESGIRVSVDNPDAGAGAITVGNVDYDCAPVAIGFNATYLLDVLAQIESEAVLIKLCDSGAPTIIQDRDGAAALYVLMPMRVSDSPKTIRPQAIEPRKGYKSLHAPSNRRERVREYLTKRADRAERLRADRVSRVIAYLETRKARADRDRYLLATKIARVHAYLKTRKARGAAATPASDLTSAPAIEANPVPADGGSETNIAGETGEWLEFLATKLGTRKWIVAGRLSAKMKAKGYEKAISPRKFDLLEAEWRAAGMKQDASRERTTMTSNNAAARRRRINAYLAKRTTHKTASPIVVAQETALTPLPADAPPLPSDGAGAPLTWLDRLDDEIHDRTRQETTNYWLAQVPANAGGVPIDAREHFELAAIAAEDARHDPRVAKLAAMFERRSEIERYRAVRAFVGTKYDVPPGMPFRDPLALAVWVIERLPVALAA